MTWKNAYDITLSGNYGKRVFIQYDHRFVMIIIIIYTQLWKKMLKEHIQKVSSGYHQEELWGKFWTGRETRAHQKD